MEKRGVEASKPSPPPPSPCVCQNWSWLINVFLPPIYTFCPWYESCCHLLVELCIYRAYLRSILLFQRFPPLELDSLQVYILRDTLFSSTFVYNEEWIRLCALAWWRRLSQLPGRSVLGLGISPSFPLQIKTANTYKNRRFGPCELLKDVLQYHYLVVEKVKLVFT